MVRHHILLVLIVAQLVWASLSTPLWALDYDTVLGQMRELQRERRWQEFVAQFGETRLTEWPADVNKHTVEALVMRAQARGVLKQGREAEADLLAALKLAPQNEVVGIALADNYANVLNDDARALASYRQVLDKFGHQGGSWATAQARISVARLLTDQVRPDEALQVLEQADFSKLAPPWKIKTLRAFAHAYAAQGNEAAALAKFREALELEQTQP